MPYYTTVLTETEAVVVFTPGAACETVGPPMRWGILSSPAEAAIATVTAVSAKRSS